MLSLLAIGCAPGPAMWGAGPESPLAVGAVVADRFYVWVAGPPGRSTGYPARLVSVEDDGVARLEGNSLRAVGPGATLVRFTADLPGGRVTAAHRVEVREVARREWWFDGRPVRGDVRVSARDPFAIPEYVTLDADGNELDAGGLPIPSTEDWRTFDRSVPGRHLIPDTGWWLVVTDPRYPRAPS